jgi:uncharacterized protein DUF5683
LNKYFAKLLFTVILSGAFIVAAEVCFAQVAEDTAHHVTTDRVTQRKPAADSLSNQSRADTTDDDTVAVVVKKGPWQPNPKKAGLFSAILPGLGQVYNRQYWKVPVVYAGIAVAGYYINNNLTKYRSYRQAYINRINNPNYVDQYSGIYDQSQLQQLQNDASKYLDLSVLFTGIGFMVQIVDAITSAHLKNFDISRDISMHVTPVIFPQGAGLGLVMNLK